MQKDLKYFRILDEQLKFVKMTMMQRKDVNDALEMIEKQLTLTDVVATLPNINSSVFKNWLKVNKYAETMNRLVYSKKDWDYDIDVLYRAFTNEIEFGN
tara:strand:- start:1261 stop:1557 length:297 start_codon:yes stop_codon:yes gene_type:complete